MIRVLANRETCEGFGNCVMVSEDIFELDDDGVVVVKQELVPDELLTEVQQATYDCPTDSISFVENEDDE